MNNLDQLSFDSSKYFLGKLCPTKHDWKGTGLSLRYVDHRRCVECSRTRSQLHGQAKQAKRKELNEGALVGRGGSVRHREITDLIRCKALAALNLADRHHVACLVTGVIAGGSMPDVTFICKHSQEKVFIEVGAYNPCKWESDIGVIHIGFNGRISKVNFNGQSTLQPLLYKTISELLQNRIELPDHSDPVVPTEAKNTSNPKMIRNKALLALITSGLSITEISGLKVPESRLYSARLTVRHPEKLEFWLPQKAATDLNQWLLVRRELAPSSTDALFIALDRRCFGHSMSGSAIRYASIEARNLLFAGHG